MGAIDPVRSMNDLRWHLTEAALAGEAVTLEVGDAHGRGVRTVTLSLAEVPAREVDAELMRRIGVGALFSEPVMGRILEGGPAQRAGLREGDRVLAIGDRPVADAAQLREWIRGSVRDGVPQPMTWRIERDGQRLALEVLPAYGTEGASAPRIEAYIGTPPALVTVRYGLLEGLTQAVLRAARTALQPV